MSGEVMMARTKQSSNKMFCAGCANATLLCCKKLCDSNVADTLQTHCTSAGLNQNGLPVYVRTLLTSERELQNTFVSQVHGTTSERQVDFDI
jgi:hypothetical protein